MQAAFSSIQVISTYKNPQEDLAKTKVSTQLLRDLGIKGRSESTTVQVFVRDTHVFVQHHQSLTTLGSRKTILSFLLSFFRELFSTFCCGVMPGWKSEKTIRGGMTGIHDETLVMRSDLMKTLGFLNLLDVSVSTKRFFRQQISHIKRPPSKYQNQIWGFLRGEK